MAIIRKSLNEIKRSKSRADWAKAGATTDREIWRQIARDVDTARGVTRQDLASPQNLRRQLAMTQVEFARALRIPVATLRNWEQGRNALDPAARSLLLVVARNPKAALAALAADAA
ncbi:MAG: helix-turn-helix domain-containing protein [Alphaproteobacteria bacterium]|nr:helix-turn-helix domain-containing protein [Alphaproteobacteria bacterium]